MPRALEHIDVPARQNSGGEEVVFHSVRFPFARGATQALIGEQLGAVPAMQRENANRPGRSDGDLRLHLDVQETRRREPAQMTRRCRECGTEFTAATD